MATFQLDASDNGTQGLARAILAGDKDPHRFERRMADDPKFRSIVLATKVPDAGGELAEIRDPYVRAKVADALDLSGIVKNAPALFDLAAALAGLGYHSSSDKVRKQA